MHPDEYGRLAALEAIHWWYRSLHDLILARIDAQAQTLPHRPRILDAGCGTGLMARKLATRGEAVAMDLSPIAAQYWPERWLRAPGSGAIFLQGSISALPFRDESFDAVVSLDVLYHLQVKDDRAAAREMGRVLRPGGILVLNLPAYDALRSTHDRVVHTARRYTRARVHALLAAAGLETLRVRHWNTLLFPIAAALRLGGRLREAIGSSAREESDLHPVSPWLNEALRRVVGGELTLWDHWGPPFGLSIVAVARKPGAGDSPCAG